VYIELREVEIIVQQRVLVEGIDAGEKEILAKIQGILYDTTVSRYGCLNQTKLMTIFAGRLRG
jgi:hypothetical protein